MPYGFCRQSKHAFTQEIFHPQGILSDINKWNTSFLDCSRASPEKFRALSRWLPILHCFNNWINAFHSLVPGHNCLETVWVPKTNKH